MKSQVKSSKKNNYSVGLSTMGSNQRQAKGNLVKKITIPCHVSNVPFSAPSGCDKISLSNF